jgi:hypothetical protein
MLQCVLYWLRVICGAGILLTIGASSKVLPIWFAFIGLALLVAFFVVVIAWVLERRLVRLGIWRGRNGS